MAHAAIYALIAAALGALGWMLALRQAALRSQPVNFIVSDGRGYYVFLPAVAIDHTFDFSRQIQMRWGDDFDPALLQRRTERGYIKSRYTIGMALSLVPAFVTAHVAAVNLYPHLHDSRLQPDGYSLVYQASLFSFVLLLGWGTMLLIDRLMVGHLSLAPGPTMAAVALFWLGSHYAWYYFREPMMVHVVSTFWVTLAIFASAKLLEDADAGQLRRGYPLLLTTALSMAVLCRPTNVFLAPVMLLVLHRLHRAKLLLRCVCTFWILGLTPLAAQAYVCWRMTGHILASGYGKTEGFNWMHPALWQTLLSTRHGLFIWTPITLVCVIGLLIRLHRGGRGQGLLVALAFSAAILWYANSAWRDWWFGWGYGNRAFLELTPVFVFGLGSVLQLFLVAGPKSRRAMVYGAAMLILYNAILMSLYAARIIPPDNYWF